MDQRAYLIPYAMDHIYIKRIDKRIARREFDSGKTVFLLGVNLRPGMMWHPCPIEYDPDEEVDWANQFDRHNNNFRYYNCDYERGYYPAFYVTEV